MHQGLSDAFAQQLQQLESLQQILETELSLISAREPDALIKLLDDKETLLNSIAELDQTIATLHRQDPDALTQDENFQQAVEQIQRLLEECRYRTEINQRAVEQGQLKLSHLRALIVESRAKESMTYDKTGITRGGTKGKGVSA